MKQAHELGAFLRRTYVERLGFLPPALGTGYNETFIAAFTSDSGEEASRARGESFVCSSGI